MPRKMPATKPASQPQKKTPIYPKCRNLRRSPRLPHHFLLGLAARGAGPPPRRGAAGTRRTDHLRGAVSWRREKKTSKQGLWKHEIYSWFNLSWRPWKWVGYNPTYIPSLKLTFSLKISIGRWDFILAHVQGYVRFRDSVFNLSLTVHIWRKLFLSWRLSSNFTQVFLRSSLERLFVP